jgi:ABC-type ATPase involved in cell division
LYDEISIVSLRRTTFNGIASAICWDNTMIKVEGLTKRYARTVAVDNISFEVEKGQIVGFLGPNGAGKTTTMRVLTCFLPPTEGTANVAGFDVMEHPLEVKKRIGYLPETPPVYPEMEVADYLDFAGRLKLIPSSDIRRRVAVSVVVEAADGHPNPTEVQQRLEQVSGVSRVMTKESKDGHLAFEVESLQGRHIRSDLARTVVNSGWGLNELRSVGLSLEEIFLQLTASEQKTQSDQKEKKEDEGAEKK